MSHAASQYTSRAQKRSVVITSYDRVNPADDSGSFRVDISRSLQGHNVSHIAVLGASVPNTAINVTSYNNQIKCTNSNGTSTVSVATGMYDGASLATAVADALTADGTLADTYTGSYDTSSFKISITSTSLDFTIAQSGVSNAMTYVAGLSSVDSSTSSSNVLTFPFVAVLVYPYVVLRIHEMSIELPLEFNVSQGAYASTQTPYGTRREVFVNTQLDLHTVHVEIVSPENRVLNLQGAPVMVELLTD